MDEMNIVRSEAAKSFQIENGKGTLIVILFKNNLNKVFVKYWRCFIIKITDGAEYH